MKHIGCISVNSICRARQMSFFSYVGIHISKFADSRPQSQKANTKFEIIVHQLLRVSFRPSRPYSVFVFDLYFALTLHNFWRVGVQATKVKHHKNKIPFFFLSLRLIIIGCQKFRYNSSNPPTNTRRMEMKNFRPLFVCSQA